MVHGWSAVLMELAVEKALAYHEEFKSACIQDEAVKYPCQLRWSAPTDNMLKINTDGAIDLLGCLVGIGIVIRNDHYGQTK